MARDQNGDAIALGIGIIALRDPAAVLRVLDSRPGLDGPAALLLDAFDLLNEDFDEERFFMALRRQYWAAPEGSSRRRVADLLIQRLEF
jgi:hypothetical protein